MLPPRYMGYASHASELYIKRNELPEGAHDLQACEGREDPRCISGSHSIPGLPPVFAHRDYLIRVGLCWKKAAALVLGTSREDL